jgi:hypothetical protein
MSDIYLTPDRYRAIGTGLDLSGVSDTELRFALQSASEAINSAVNAPDGYSFLGGSVTGEEHNWKVIGRAPKRTDGRLWPYNRPVKAVSQVQVFVTKEQSITFTDDQLFLQADMSYVEPIGAPTTTALFTSVPPWLLTSPVAHIDYTYGFEFTVTDETMAVESGGSLRAGNQFWFTDEDVELKKNGVVVLPADYEVDYEEGTIMPNAPDITATWKASYHHKLPPGIAAATALVATDIRGASAIAASGMLGLSGIRVEEIELRQSSKVNYMVTPVNNAAMSHIARYRAMFVSMR